MPAGGKRPGAGRPKGSRNPSTITKEAAREALRQIVLREMEGLVSAQIAHAKGLNYLVARDRTTGKFQKVTAEMLEAWDRDPANMPTVMEVWQKDPSVQAFTDLLNRAIDKPAEQLQEIKVTGDLNLVSRLHAARQRLSKRPDAG